MGISFGSINSGLPKDIVQQIMKAEKIPIKKMEGRKDSLKSKQALVDELKQKVEDIRGFLAKNANARALKELKVDTDESIVGVTLDKNVATTGNYQFEVVQLAQKSSAMSSGVANKDESYIGVGFIQYTLPNGDTREVYIDSDNATLSGVAKAINMDEESGLRANVVNDGSGSDSPWRLVLSLNESGDINNAEFPYFYFVDGIDDLYLEFEREAQDAIIKMDGFEIEVPENKISDIIPGATIDLKKAKPGEEFSINITEDTKAVSEKITSLIEKINAVLKFIKEQNTLDENSDTSSTLGGDILLQTLQGRLRGVIFEEIKTPNGNKRVGQIGVTFNREGLLDFDQKKFEAALSEDYQSVSQILTGLYKEDGEKEEGLMDKLNKMANLTLRYPDGVIPSRQRGLRSKMESINRRIKQKERFLAQKEKNLKNKFARLESTISEIKNQGAGLASLGAAAPNPVSQLG